MKMDSVAIKVQNLTKTYGQTSSLVNIMKSFFLRDSCHESTAFKALDDVSFILQKGEKVALLGRNGAGKSTLLKHLLGTYKPTFGSVYVQGFLYPLMHIGSGFHALLSGYENTKMYLMNLGLYGRNLKVAMDNTFAFAELDDVLHQPFQTYSLGMKMRLQFGAATSIKPDILVVDEVLGAGDAYFVRKSAKRIHNLTSHGTTLLLVSHNMTQVLEFCDRALWLEKGKLIADAPAFELVNRYEAFLMNGFKDETSFLDDGREVYRWKGKRGISLQSVMMDPLRTQFGSKITLKLILRIEQQKDYSCEYLLTLWNRQGQCITRIRWPIDHFSGKEGEERILTVAFDPLMIHGQTIAFSFSIYDKAEQENASPFFDIVTRFLSWNIPSLNTPYLLPSFSDLST